VFRGPQRAVLSGGWRGVFYVNVPIGLIALVLGPAATAGSGSGDTHLDLVGSLLLGGGVLRLVLVVNGEMIGPGRLLWLYLARPCCCSWRLPGGRSAPGAGVDGGCSIRSWRAPPGYAGRIGHGLPRIRYPCGWRARYAARCRSLSLIGSAIGTAVLATIFYQVLTGTWRDCSATVSRLAGCLRHHVDGCHRSR
jgi:hypothetical protein